MGRPRKKVEKESEFELMEADEPMPQTKQVEAEHTIKYKQPFNIPTLPDEDEDDDLSIDYDEEERPKPKKIKLSIREKLKAKLQGSAIGETDQVALRIDRLPYYDANGQTGLQADREFCSIIKCQIEFITNDEYLAETSKRHGAGMYWFTIRHYKSIMASWSHRVGGAPQVANVQAENGSNPQIVYQQIPGSPPAIPITKSLKELADVIEVVDRIRGNRNDPAPAVEHPQVAPLSPDVQLASLLMADSDLKKKAIVNLLGTKDKETDYIALAIEHGPTIIDAIGKAIQAVVREVKLPLNGSNNGQSDRQSMAPQQPQGPIWDRNRQTVDQSPERVQAPQLQNLPQTTAIAEGSELAERIVTDPRDELFRIALEGCTRNDPPQVTAGQITAWAEHVEENYPTHSIWGWVDVFTGQTTEEVVTLLQTGALGEAGQQIATIPHAPKWIGELQKLLKVEEEKQEE